MKSNAIMPIELIEFTPMTRSSEKKTNDREKSILKMKHNLIERKKLHFRCRRVNDMMCIFGLSGLILMIIDTEFRLTQISRTDINMIRPLISISSGILIVLVFYYHILNARLYAINNHIVDWRITLRIRGLVMMICEVIVCSIHPFPYSFKFLLSHNILWLEMMLTLPMFGRLYLIARSVTLHSPLVNAASSRTIGYLNRVPITISFILRAFLQTYPVASWSSMLMIILFIASWSMHACEKGMWMPINSVSSRANASTSTFINATWLTIVTFTTVGYGDIVPQTYCGRGVSVFTALFGVFASAVLIAVFISKISLSRSEQMVLDFVSRINQAREYKIKTMQIIQYSVRAWFLKRRDPQYRASFNLLSRLHTAIRQAKVIKQQQRNAISENESLMTVLTNVYYEQKTNEKNFHKLNQHCDLIEDRINRIETKLDTLLTIFTQNIPTSQHSWL
ncbi:unnamed protein product [Adineta steineri]|uniref:Potassium channel domain-containing protein n=1 Tax=Adineta steineri TaxID=433720 RepID=A0A819BV50_9BILA|nr:unnamed protein product [Adineta steineri]CAF3808220.1 unnamed protein product [Adineta steineri]